MSEFTNILLRIKQGEAGASAELLPLVYDELRRLAARQLAVEPSGQTLQPTALVHEAYLRLVETDVEPQWENLRHFYASAAESMRRILVENARRKRRIKHGGEFTRHEFDESQLVVVNPGQGIDFLDLDEALNRLAQEIELVANLVSLRYFAGLTVKQASDFLGIAPRRAKHLWAFAKAWLRRELKDSTPTL
ncbi:MAG: RNA polymerase subunit sigma, partial [Planctomycetaceae bacterium]|nr:RNA polymerase subunit sigma [Planctomycetaceae bacterium]